VRPRALFPLTAFVSALLLFQVEFILGKLILPWFGGSPAAWTTSLVVFQLLLFGGYAYAHALAGTQWKTQRNIHSAVVAASVLLLIAHAVNWPSPVTPGVNWKPHDLSHPELRALAILVAAIGLPFFVLSASVPLLAHWLERANSKGLYKLYAFSNAGALVGLLSYPVLIEPHLHLRSQGWAWTVAYGLFAIFMNACAAIAGKAGESSATGEDHRALTPAPQAGARGYWQWLALAGCVDLGQSSESLLVVLHNYLREHPMVWSRHRSSAARRRDHDRLRGEVHSFGRASTAGVPRGVVRYLHGLPRRTGAIPAIDEGPDILLPRDCRGRCAW
jgi:hypothetical protein